MTASLKRFCDNSVFVQKAEKERGRQCDKVCERYNADNKSIIPSGGGNVRSSKILIYECLKPRKDVIPEYVLICCTPEILKITNINIITHE